MWGGMGCGGVSTNPGILWGTQFTSLCVSPQGAWGETPTHPAGHVGQATRMLCAQDTDNTQFSFIIQGGSNLAAPLNSKIRFPYETLKEA